MTLTDAMLVLLLAARIHGTDDARRAKTRRSRSVVHDSHTPTGGKPKAGMPWIGVKL